MLLNLELALALAIDESESVWKVGGKREICLCVTAWWQQSSEIWEFNELMLPAGISLQNKLISSLKLILSDAAFA